MQRKINIHPVKDVEYLLTSGPDIISAVLKNGHVWEDQTLKYTEGFLKYKKAPVVIDIGANLGAFSVPVAKMIAPRGGIIHSFEPQRRVYNQLCGNIFLNDIENCYTHHAAVGDSDGVIDIPVLDIHSCSNVGALSLTQDIRDVQGWGPLERFEPVTIHSLDNLGLPLADLIKIDVEGMELEVLRGGLEYLRACGYPPMIFEVWGDYVPGMIAKGKEVIALVESLGYSLIRFDDTYIAQRK